MDTLHFESVCAIPVRTITLYELRETYFAKRIKPHCRQDRDNINRFFHFLDERFPCADTSTFDSDALEEMQRFLIAKGYDRKYINKLVNFLKSIIKWAMRKKLISVMLAYELLNVPPLEYHESIKENPEREDAKQSDIEAILPYLHPQIADMVSLQTLTGMRPSELCNLKTGEIKQEYDGENWLYLPHHHKTKGKGKKRAILLGTDEQAILGKYLTGKEADQPVFCNILKRKWKSITPETYGRRIKAAIDSYRLGKFVPYQLRHTNATWISDVLSDDHARAQLGHSSINTTKIYIKADIKKQRAVIEKRKAVGNVIGGFAPPPCQTESRPTLRIFRGE